MQSPSSKKKGLSPLGGKYKSEQTDTESVITDELRELASNRVVMDRYINDPADQMFMRDLPYSSIPSFNMLSDPARQYDDLVVDDCEDDEISLSNPPGLDIYSTFIFDDVGYQWLLDRLRREILLSSPGQDIMLALSETILRAIPTSRRLSRRVSFLGCMVVLLWTGILLGFSSRRSTDSHTTWQSPRPLLSQALASMHRR